MGVNLRELAMREPLNRKSRQLRLSILRAIEKGGRGHVGSALSVIEIISELYDSVLVHKPKDPDFFQRDIFILSKGHGCLALYAVLADHGYFQKEELDTFCKYDSRLGGHPELNDLPGIEFSTGSLGHGLAFGVGVAKAIKLREQNRKVFVILGDGELAEGSVWESASHAAKHFLDNLIVFVDYNNMQSFGNVEDVLPIGDLEAKFRSFGFNVQSINGHSREAIQLSVKSLVRNAQPSVVIAHTVKGKGFSPAENSANWHHKSTINAQELKTLLGGES